MEDVGMDLGKKESQIAIITEAGELIEKRMRTERERLIRYFKDRAVSKILLEASTISEWVARLLEEADTAPASEARHRRARREG